MRILHGVSLRLSIQQFLYLPALVYFAAEGFEGVDCGLGNALVQEVFRKQGHVIVEPIQALMLGWRRPALEECETLQCPQSCSGHATRTDQWTQHTINRDHAGAGLRPQAENQQGQEIRYRLRSWCTKIKFRAWSRPQCRPRSRDDSPSWLFAVFRNIVGTSGEMGTWIPSWATLLVLATAIGNGSFWLVRVVRRFQGRAPCPRLGSSPPETHKK